MGSNSMNRAEELNQDLENLVSGQVRVPPPPPKSLKLQENGACSCASAYLKAWLQLRRLTEIATVGGPGVPTFKIFPSFIRNRKESWIKELEEMQKACGVDIGPGSPLNPVIPRIRALDTFALNHTPFETIGEIGQIRAMLVLAVEECK